MNRPNYNYNRREKEDKYLGENNLFREFRKCFTVMLKSSYEDGTRDSVYYNEFDNRKSHYYVPQEDVEGKLDRFYEAPNDSNDFLIGFTGIGKTTLVRNYFGIIDAIPFVDEKMSFIAYLSLYKYNLRNEEELKSIYVKFLLEIKDQLNKDIGIDFSDNNVINEVYNHINMIDPLMLVKEIDFNNNGENGLSDQLNSASKEKPLEFYCAIISYLLSKQSKIKQIILINDDIESQYSALHIPFISCAQNIYTRLKSNNRRTYKVKNLIVLRNYTFRYNYARQSEARRVYEYDIILKDSIPPIHKILEKRFDAYYINESVRSEIVNEERWKESVKILKTVVEHISGFGEAVAKLANYDISHSFRIFLQIITNHKWFAPKEFYENGAYLLREDDYTSTPLKERIFRALAYGEEDAYYDEEDKILPNVMRFHYDVDNQYNRILPLYILEYMITMKRKGQVTLYGRIDQNIIGDEISEKICKILNRKDLKETIEKAVARLYEQRCVLQSIFQPEEPRDSTDGYKRNGYKRIYSPEYRLYLSLRGAAIDRMLRNDSLLIDFYRDDIDTDIYKNDKLSSQISQNDRIIYNITYISQLFDIEKSLIRDADKRLYFESLNGGFIVDCLIEGISNTLKYYYKDKKREDYTVVVSKMTELFNNIIEYKNILINEDKELYIKSPENDILESIDFIPIPPIES